MLSVAGSDCAGIVAHSLNRQTSPSPAVVAGEAVFGLAEGCLGSHVHAPMQTMVPVPECLGFDAAATLPTVCITAAAALRNAAAILPGDRSCPLA